MRDSKPHWWDRLGIQKKVWMVLLAVVLPIVAILLVQLALIKNLLDTQLVRHRTLLAREQTQEMWRLAINIEDAFRGYLLTQDEVFLGPLRNAEHQLDDTLARGNELFASLADLPEDWRHAGAGILSLLRSKQELLEKVQAGQLDEARTYVRSGRGLQLSDQVRADLRKIEERLDQHENALGRRAVELSTKAFGGLMAAVAAGVLLGVFGVRQLARSVTGPLDVIRTALLRFARDGSGGTRAELQQVTSGDEIGQLARSCEEMTGRIADSIHELQILHDVGLEITTIRPDGIDGVLQRIVDQATALVDADLCLILSRNESMGCWIVEAASGEAADRLKKTVLLWEELPISVRAYETGRPAIGERLRQETKPELIRRNIMGESILVVPLLSHGAPFGVMAFLPNREISAQQWNVRLAGSLAGAAAVAIDNARLYDAAFQKEKRTRQRLQQLEHLGEVLAHDLKAPAVRMAGLAALVHRECDARNNQHVQRLLGLIEQNGRELGQRVDQVLLLARVGACPETTEAVDPSLVVEDVLSARASELESGNVRIIREGELLPVACHRAYVYQIFDNLISNAVKFTRDAPDPRIVISGARDGHKAVFSVADNGPGIPPSQWERIFDPFVRLNPSAAEGTGIGLAIVRRIVELYGGSVWVDAANGAGCCLRFTLPLLGSLGLSDAGFASTAVAGGGHEVGEGDHA